MLVDRIVQVAWFRAPEPRTIRLLGDRFWHVDLLVIPPDTAADAARAALALVAAGDGVCALRAISGWRRVHHAAGDLLRGVLGVQRWA